MQILTLNQANRHVNFERDYIAIGCTPYDEECTQAGQDADNSIMECKALINQLRREHGKEPEGCKWFILHNFHDFGEYYEAAIFFNTSDPDETDEVDESFNYASFCECLPSNWDAEALKELREQNYFISKRKAATVVSIEDHFKTNKKAN